jgi:hypothetical protein
MQSLQAGATIVLGANGLGNIDGLYLGNAILGTGNDNFYGFGALSIDGFDPTQELEEYFIDPNDSLAELRLTTAFLSLDMATSNQLSISALSRIDATTYLELDHEHRGIVDFSTTQAASVSATWAASPFASVRIKDNYNTILWTSDNPELSFNIDISQYFVEYVISSSWRADNPGDSHIEDALSLLLAFTPQTPPPPPPPPNPPPDPDPIPEPASLATWMLALCGVRFAKKKFL